MGAAVDQLFGPGRHWFSPAVEPGEGDMLAHSFCKPTAAKLGALLLKPGATLQAVGALVSEVPGFSNYAAKFVQRDTAALTVSTPHVTTLQLDTVAIGPGARKYMELLHWHPYGSSPPSIAEPYLLDTLKWLADEVTRCVQGEHQHPAARCVAYTCTAPRAAQYLANSARLSS